MDIGNILVDLRAERERLNAAIIAIEALTLPNSNSSKHSGKKSGSMQSNGGSRMSLAARKRRSEMMKQRWAERKKKAKKS